MIVQTLDENQKRAVVRQFSSPRLDAPDTKRFVIRLLLTLYGKHALCWSWVTVKNTVWLPSFRRWLYTLIDNGEIPDPPDDCFRTVGGLVFSSHPSSETEDANGVERDPYVYYITTFIQQYIHLHGGFERIESLRATAVGR
jgi:hypothetical protein